MCGRYRLSRRKQIIGEYFDTADWQDDWSPRYNIAPTQSVPVVRQHPKENVKQLSLMKWGLIPNWASDPAIASRTINAKSETAATKPAFRDPLKYRRCLVPADGFYEWVRSTTSKQPFCFEVNRGELFAFAGLWDGWKDPSLDGNSDVEQAIPFWEFLDVEFDSAARTFHFVAYYTQQPNFPNLFHRLIGSPALRKLTDDLLKEDRPRIYKADWKPRSDFNLNLEQKMLFTPCSIRRPGCCTSEKQMI
jgi:putative SOS response-associated peptidase YedK